MLPSSEYLDARNGGYYVAGSRIGLDIVAHAFRRGRTAEDIFRSFPAIPLGASDPEVLQIAAGAGRVLVSADVRTMPDHVADFTARGDSPGLVLIPSSRSYSSIMDGLLLI